MPHLIQWGKSATFGIFEGLCFSNGELVGCIDKDGDMCEFTDKKAAAKFYAKDIERLLEQLS